MIRRILVGLDGREKDGGAADYSLSLARHLSAQLLSMSIVDEPGIREGEAVPLGASHFKEERDQKRIEQRRHELARILETYQNRAKQIGVPCEVALAAGEPATCLGEEAERCDVIVLGSQSCFHFGASPGTDSILGDTIRQVARPVIVVPDAYHVGSEIAIAYDGSLQSSRTLASFATSGLALRATVHVIAIASDSNEAARKTHRACDFLTLHGALVKAHPVVSTNSAGVMLLRTVDQLRAGLLVMGAYGQSPLKSFFFGSVTRTVLRDAQLPVFVAH